MATIKKPVKKYAMGGMTTTSETTKKPKVNPKDDAILFSTEDTKKRRGRLRLPTSKAEEKAYYEKMRKEGAKNGKTIKKAKTGAKFDLNKDGKTTFKDVLIGRGVLPKTAKKGATLKKQAATAIAKKRTMKMGGTIKKAEDGYTGKQNRLARQEKRVYNRYTDAKASGNIKKSGRLYDKLIDKQTKSIKAGVDVQYKSGGSMKKCKYGCK
jgi:hypothetical protein